MLWMRYQNPVSLFEPVYTEGGDTLYVMDQISDKKNKEETWVENLSLREAINRLNKRERHIIDLRFYEGKTQMEVAQEIGISQAQVSRLEKNALKNHAELSESVTEIINPGITKSAPYMVCCMNILQNRWLLASDFAYYASIPEYV